MKARIALLTLPALLLVACAGSPALTQLPERAAPPPDQLMQSPSQYEGMDVVWGGRVVDVRNFERHSEIEVVGYPLDGRQRPQVEAGDQGRFILVVPDFVEPADYPPGRLVSLVGRFSGVREGHIGERAYRWPEVVVRELYRWSPDELRQPSRVRFGIGVGIRL